MNNKTNYRIMVFGVGAFSQGVLRVSKEGGAEVCTYLTRDYAHYGPMSEGKTFHKEYYPNPCEVLVQEQIDFVIPRCRWIGHCRTGLRIFWR